MQDNELFAQMLPPSVRVVETRIELEEGGEVFAKFDIAANKPL